MSGRFGEQAKIVGRTDQALAEMPLPDAIDDYPGGEWVFLSGNPVRQFQTAAAFFDLRLRFAGEEPRQMAWDYWSQARVTAADMDRHILNVGKQAARHPSFLHSHRHRIWRWQLSLKRVTLLDQHEPFGMVGGN